MQLHRATEASWKTLELMASHPRCVAIGETGLDVRAAASAQQQILALRRHIMLSERFAKPLIIHCVKSLDTLIELKKELQPRQPWLWHGFRGAPQMAAQLRRHSIIYSFGPHFNAASAASTPSDMLFVETDASSADISRVIDSVARARSEDSAIVRHNVMNNAKTFVNLHTIE